VKTRERERVKREKREKREKSDNKTREREEREEDPNGREPTNRGSGPQSTTTRKFVRCPHIDPVRVAIGTTLNNAQRN